MVEVITKEGMTAGHSHGYIKSKIGPLKKIDFGFHVVSDGNVRAGIGALRSEPSDDHARVLSRPGLHSGTSV